MKGKRKKLMLYQQLNRLTYMGIGDEYSGNEELVYRSLNAYTIVYRIIGCKCSDSMN